jgi:kynurenine formamidase
MQTTIKIEDNIFQIDLSKPLDISIPLDFYGPQPGAFGVEPAISSACEYGELVGDTRRGGSCNFERVTLIPHCNGTHTECVGHITNERISILACLNDVLIPANLISVGPEFVGDDLVISEVEIERALRPSLTNAVERSSTALIVRTLPNDASKRTLAYDADYIPPYFTKEAIEFIVEKGFRHLLVDLPSIDRLFDEGKLLNHRVFWNVEPNAFETNVNTRMNATITELIYVPNEIANGEYLLNLQIAPFSSDAAPSRPVLFEILG